MGGFHIGTDPPAMTLDGVDVLGRETGFLQNRNATLAMFGREPFVVDVMYKTYDPPHLLVFPKLSGEMPHHRLHGKGVFLEVLRGDVGGE